MTLILKSDLNIGKMYLYTKNEVPSINHSKVTAWTDTQTDRPDWNYYLSAYTDGNDLPAKLNYNCLWVWDF